MAAISWKSGVGGDWATASDWSNGTVPGAGDDVTVGVAGTYTVTIDEAQAAHSLTVKAAGATLTDNSTLTLGTTLTMTAGTFQLNGGGVISGGTLSATGGAFVWDSGTISGVTYRGTIDMSAAGASLRIGAAGLIATGSGGTGAGTINVSGANSQLFVVNNQTLDKATVNLGATSGYAYLFDDDTTSTNHTLTLGAGLTINHVGIDAALADAVGYAGDGFVNEGTINAGVSGGQFLIEPSSFVNQGAIAVSNGDTMTIEATTWSSTGTITVTSATLNLYDAFASSSLTKLTNTNGKVVVAGTMTNTGAVLSVGTGSKLGQLTLASSGLISGGTIKDAGGGFVWSDGTLDGVTYDGTLDMSAASSALRIGADGLIAKNAAGTAAGTINVTGSDAALIVVNNQTIDKATINLGAASGYAYIYDDDTTSTNHTLTFGAELTIDQTGANAALADAVGYAGDGFVNEGTINAGVSGGQFLIDSSSFANQGTIAVSNGDTLTINSANWSSTGAITLNSATINLNDNFASSSLASFTNTNGKVVIGGTMTNTGAVLSVGTGTKLGQLTLASGGLISGGTIKDAGGGFVWSGGSLDGVTYDGTLDMSAASSTLRIGVDGLIAKTKAGTAAGTINVTGSNAALIFVNNQTIDKATINLGAASGYAYIYDDDTTSTNHTLTFGAGLTIDQTGANAALADAVGYAGDGFVNEGKINAAINGGQFQINSSSFANQGTIAVSNGDTLAINDPNWSNTGAITATNATIKLNGAFASSSLAKLTNNSSQVIIGGTVTNSGPPLSVGTGAKLAQLTLASGGLISGGTIKDAGGGFVWSGGTLDGVTYDGTLDMSAASSTLRIGVDGLIAKNAAGTAAGTINVTGSNAALIFVNNQTIDKATINLGAASGYAYIYDDDTTSTNHTLTFGAGITIDQTGANAALADAVGYAGDGFVNEGKINAAINGGQFQINSSSFANQGTIAVSNGDTLAINDPTWSSTGAITATKATIKLNGAFASSSLAKLTNNSSQVIIGGTVTNSGPPLSVGTGAKLAQLTLASGGLISGGTIKDAGGGFVWSGGTLNGVTYDGTLDMSASGASLHIGALGLTAKGAGGTGPGTINLTGSNSALLFTNNQTIDNATINLGANSGSAYLEDWDTTSTNHVLTLGAHLIINQAGANALMTDAVGYAGDGFVNNGAINADVAGGHFTIQSQSFDNLGSIAVGNGDTLMLQPAVLTNFSAGTLTGGTFEADAGSTFQLPNNALVTTLDATVILNGAGSVLQSLNTTGGVQAPIDTTLTTIGKAGTLEVLGGRNWTSTQALSNEGALMLGGGTFDPASLTNTGTVSGYGVIGTTVTNHGVVTAAASQVLSLVGGKLTNLVGTTLTGGQFTVGLNGTIELANNVQVVTDSALIALNGASSKMQSFSTSTKAQVALNSTMTSITAAGTLELLGNRNWSSTNAMANAGTLKLGGGAFAPASLTSTGTVSGYGIIDTVFTNNGAVAVTAAETMSLVGGTLKNLAGTTLTGGTYTVGNGATLQLANNSKITTLDAMMTLSNSAVVQSLNTTSSMQVSLESSLTTIGAAGELDLLGARGYSTTNAIANSGTLDMAAGTFKSGKLSELAGSTLTGFGTVTAAVTNAGVINATGGTLVFSGAITGAGSVTIAGGAASFASTFAEAVTFKTSGTLTLAHSLTYTGKIGGFSVTGATSLDLRDVGFVSAGEATFSGTTSGGVLTVSDGTHTAKINLVGNYTGSTFTASSDGSGGVIVVDPTPGAPRPEAASPPAFVAAMAAMGSSHAASTSSHPEGWRPGTTTLSLPRPSFA